MDMMKRVILALLIAVLAIPVAAMACPGQGMGKGKGWGGAHFERMDTNNDGVVSAEEHAAAAASRFSKMDSNGDGKLTHEEMQQHWQQMHQNRQGECPWKEDCPNWKNCPRNKGSK